MMRGNEATSIVYRLFGFVFTLNQWRRLSDPGNEALRPIFGDGL